MNEYRWLTESSQQFLDRDYLVDGQSVDERVDEICGTAETLLKKPGFARKFKSYFKKGWFSFSTPVWTNFGNDRGLPISCFGSHIQDNCESITSTYSEVFMMTKYGGGTSAYFGELRPRGAKIRKNGESSGSVHFMGAFDNLINVVSQGRCYVEGTEVLTDSGFKDFRDVMPTDKLAELDECNNVSFTSTYQMVVEEWDGDLVCLRGKKAKDSVAIKVTPNHRMVVVRRKMEDRKRYWPAETEIVLAKDLKFHRDNRLVLAGWGGDGDGLSDRDRLRIAYQADGMKDGPNRKIHFHFKKKRKIERLTMLLDRADIDYEVIPQFDGTTDITLEYDSDIKYSEFKDWVKLESVSGRWAEEFIDELRYWDGRTAHGGDIVYSSVVKSNVEWVQSIACLADKKTRLWDREPYGNRQKLYCICVSEGAYRSGEAVETYSEHYNGKVYCAIVPKGRLLVRYNGRVMVCGNTRRGNFAAYLPIDHKDIMEFLQIKSEGFPVQDLHFGVCVPDWWMKEMIGDATASGGDKEKRKVWAKVLESRANVGEPYIIFIDTVNENTVDCYKDNGLRVTHSNLCAEIALPDGPDESFVCDLSSMNILYYDEWKDTDAVEMLAYLLDAVMTEFIQKASKISFMDRAVRFAERHRAVGIGWLGWHSYLQSRMVPWESMEAKFLNVQVARTIKEQAYKASAKMAKEYGEPDACKGYGRRNATLIAIAPTKSSAFILGQVSEGIEPHRTNYFIKDLQKGKYTIKNPHLEELLRSKGKDTDDVWLDILKHTGSVQHLDFLSDYEKAVFKTFAEISPKEIIIQAAQRQKYIDQSQSLNLMIHPSIPTKDVNRLMIEAWEMGVKSLYYQIGVNAAQEFSRNILACAACES